ncbi:hypothetical protein [Erwinia phage COW86c]
MASGTLSLKGTTRKLLKLLKIAFAKWKLVLFVVMVWYLLGTITAMAVPAIAMALVVVFGLKFLKSKLSKRPGKLLKRNQNNV